MSPPTLSVGDQVWFASESGLYRYDKIQDEWSVFALGNIRDIGVNEGIIWVASDNGISNSDVRFSDWRTYKTGDGIPSDNAISMAFSRDYVWIGTDAGVGRFDKLLEEWKTYAEPDGLAGKRVNDIAVDADVVWFATSNGVSRLEIDFDKWTNYGKPELPSLNVLWTTAIGEYVWFVTDNGLARYDKRLRTWKSYSLADGITSYQINNAVVSGENIWLATKDGVSIYDPISDSWSPGIAYHAMLPSKNVMDIALDGDIIWFCTDKGVSAYDKKTGRWRHYKTSDGLLDEKCRTIIVSAKVFVVTETGINIYDKGTQDWEAYELSRLLGKAKGVVSDRGFRLDNQGVGYDFSKDGNVRLSGFSSIEFLNNSRLKPESKYENTWKTTNDLALKASIPYRRSIVGFYDDVKKDNIEYGLTYRGNETDILQEANAGEFKAEMRNSEIIEDANLLGFGGRLRQNFDGVRINVEPRYGRQRGYFETDFFIYKTGTSIYTLSHENIIPDTDEIIVKNQRLQRGADYLIVYPSGWLMFYREELLEEGENIEVRYQYEPDGEEIEKENLAILTTGVDFGNNYYAGVDVLHSEEFDVVSVNGDGKNIELGPVSIRLRPEAAYSRYSGDDDDLSGVGARGDIFLNAPRTQLKLDYAEYSQDFWTLGRRKTRFGELDRHLGAFSQIDIASWLPLTMLWQRDKSGENNLEEDFRANLVFSKLRYPILALTGEREKVNSSDFDSSRNSVRGDLQYELPESLLSYVKFRKAEVKGYYKEARGESIDNQDKTQTGYAKIQVSPYERFVLSTSYKINRNQDKPDGSQSYQLRDEIQRWLIRWDFSSIKGIVSNLYLDDLRSQDATKEDKNRNLSASLNLIPGVWTRKLEMLTFLGRYSLIQQTIPVTVEPEGDEKQQANRDSRSLRLQTHLRPHNTILCTGTYDRVKSWVEDIQPVKNFYQYRIETEFKPRDKSRIMLEYLQDHENEDTKLQKSSYSPSLWWENRWSQSWTTRLRGIYQRQNIRELGEIKETGSTLTPSLSFRYNVRELPYNGRLYITHGLSVSIYRAEREQRELSSETYAASLMLDWKITGNFSLRLRGSVSYEDNHSQGGIDKGTASIYTRAMARF